MSDFQNLMLQYKDNKISSAEYVVGLVPALQNETVDAADMLQAFNTIDQNDANGRALAGLVLTEMHMRAHNYNAPFESFPTDLKTMIEMATDQPSIKVGTLEKQLDLILEAYKMNSTSYPTAKIADYIAPEQIGEAATADYTTAIARACNMARYHKNKPFTQENPVPYPQNGWTPNYDTYVG